MFSTAEIPTNSAALRVYIGGDEDEAYALVADLSPVLGIKSDSVRAEISRGNLGSLVHNPALKRYLQDQEIIPSNAGKTSFATADIWKPLLKHRLDLVDYDAVERALTEAIEQHRLKQQQLVVEPEQPAALEEDEIEEIDEAAHILARDSQQPENDSIESDSDQDSSDSLNVEKVNSSSSDSDDDSSDVSDEDTLIPTGTPDWIVNTPVVADQFSPDDYTKSYSLKSYDTPRALKKELKKLNKWWSKTSNHCQPRAQEQGRRLDHCGKTTRAVAVLLRLFEQVRVCAAALRVDAFAGPEL